MVDPTQAPAPDASGSAGGAGTCGGRRGAPRAGPGGAVQGEARLRRRGDQDEGPNHRGEPGPTGGGGQAALLGRRFG